MRRILLALMVATLAILGWQVPQAQAAQDTKQARGSIASIAADSITVKVGTTDMSFAVDAKTHVEARGGSTAMAKAEAAGKPGPKLGDLLKVGDAVEVSYTEAGGRHATSIRKVSTPGSGGVPDKTASGTVTAVSASSLTIEGSGGGGSKFSQTYVINEKTKVVARGASTATASTGGRGTVTSLIAKGDKVSVSFEEAGANVHAKEIRVTAKAAK